MKVNLQNYKICSIQSRLSNSQINFVRGDKPHFTIHSREGRLGYIPLNCVDHDTKKVSVYIAGQ